MRRLGLARGAGDPLFALVQASGWEPVSAFWTRMTPTDAPPPVAQALAAIILSPAGGRAARLPKGLPCLVTGEATARAVAGHSCRLPETPDAEGLWALLQREYPEGGDFLLIRGERSRGFLEEAVAGSAWRLHPWITHQEVAAEPFPETSDLDAVLALSPLQAELLGGRCPNQVRLAWGQRAAEAFARVGAPATATCEPRPEALGRILESLA